MEFKDFFVIFIVIGLFIFALVSFSISLSSENNAAVNLNQESRISKLVGNISSTLNKSSDDSDAAKKAFAEETKNPIIATFGFIFKSILSAGSMLLKMKPNVAIMGFFVSSANAFLAASESSDDLLSVELIFPTNLLILDS